MDKTLEYFIKNPEKEFHVRELARLAKKAPTTVSFYLRKYEKKGLLKSTRKLNHLFFKANIGSISFKQAKLYYNLTIVYESGLLLFLEEEFNHPEAIVLFGSFANAENTPNSDIDIVVISPIRKEVNLKKFEEKLRHKIQLFVLSRQDIEKMKKKNKELLNNLINGVNLSGYFEVFR